MRSLSGWAVVAVVSVSVGAIAGNGKPGSSCKSGNDCTTHRCTANICRPNCQSNGGLGAFCENDCHCASKKCGGGKCIAPKAEAGSSSKSGSSSSSHARPSAEPAAEVEPEVIDDKTDAVTLDDCGKDLRATVLTGDLPNGDHDARSICKKFKPETIAATKVLFLGKYGQSFTQLARMVEKHTPAQMECAKKLYDATPVEKRGGRSLSVPAECTAAPPPDAAVGDACVADLVATVYATQEKGWAKDKAKELCEKFTPEVIAKTKKVNSEGFVRNFQSALLSVKAMNDAEFECARAYYAKQEGSDRDRLDFIRPDSCKGKK